MCIFTNLLSGYRGCFLLIVSIFGTIRAPCGPPEGRIQYEQTKPSSAVKDHRIMMKKKRPIRHIDYQNGSMLSCILQSALPLLAAQILNLLYHTLECMYFQSRAVISNYVSHDILQRKNDSSLNTLV